MTLRPVGDSADVVVVGGGVIGCSIAYFLALAGGRVTLLERSHRAALRSSHSSGRNCCAAAATLAVCSATRAACSNSDSSPLKLAAMKSGSKLIVTCPAAQ